MSASQLAHVARSDSSHPHNQTLLSPPSLFTTRHEPTCSTSRLPSWQSEMVTASRLSQAMPHLRPQERAPQAGKEQREVEPQAPEQTSSTRGSHVGSAGGARLSTQKAEPLCCTLIGADNGS